MAGFEFSLDIDRVDVNQAGVNEMLYSPTGNVGTYLRRSGRRIQLAARAQVGKDTGALADSIYFDIRRVGAVPTLVVGSDNEVAYIHHEGVRPHVIEARSAKALRFSQQGRIVYARSVMHPGTPPNRYLSDNLYLGGL